MSGRLSPPKIPSRQQSWSRPPSIPESSQSGPDGSGTDEARTGKLGAKDIVGPARGGIGSANGAGGFFKNGFAEPLPHSPVVPLLKAWPPRTAKSSQGVAFSVRVWRASTRQPFGIVLDTAQNSSERKHLTAVVAEDLPHLGILKGDALLSINGHVPTSARECRHILTEAIVIRLVLQRFERTSNLAHVGAEFGDGVRAKTRAPQLLLSVTRASVVDEATGEFRLTIHRSSQSQKFGLCFTQLLPSGNGEALIIVSQHLPHLALRKGDHVVTMNGMALKSRGQCEELLKSAFILGMSVRREACSAGGLRSSELVHHVQLPEPAVDSSSEEEGEEGKAAEMGVEQNTGDHGKARCGVTLNEHDEQIMPFCVAIGCAVREADTETLPRPPPIQPPAMPMAPHAIPVGPEETEPRQSKVDSSREAQITLREYEPRPVPTICVDIGCAEREVAKPKPGWQPLLLAPNGVPEEVGGRSISRDSATDIWGMDVQDEDENCWVCWG